MINHGFRMTDYQSRVGKPDAEVFRSVSPDTFNEVPLNTEENAHVHFDKAGFTSDRANQRIHVDWTCWDRRRSGGQARQCCVQRRKLIEEASHSSSSSSQDCCSRLMLASACSTIEV